MPSSQGKIWYINNQTNKIYRFDNYGYDMNTGEKKLLLKDIDNGSRWIINASDLYKEVLHDGRPIKLWEEMPDGWHPVGQDTPYPGYTDDPRKDADYGNNAFSTRHINRSPDVDNAYRRRNSFRR